MKKFLIILLIIIVLAIGVPSSISLVRAFVNSEEPIINVPEEIEEPEEPTEPEEPEEPTEPEEPEEPEEPTEPEEPEEPEEPTEPEEPEEPEEPGEPINVDYDSRIGYVNIYDKRFYTEQQYLTKDNLNPLDYEQIEVLYIEWALYSLTDVYQVGYNEKFNELNLSHLFAHYANYDYEIGYVKFYPATSVYNAEFDYTSYNWFLYLNGCFLTDISLSWVDSSISANIDDYIRFVETGLGVTVVVLQPFIDDVVIDCISYGESFTFRCET